VTLNLDKPSRKRVSLRDVVRHVTDRVDPDTSGLERFLAGEHIPSRDMAITTWGVIGQDPIGPMFYKRFKPGHVLYVSRRTYLRKVAVPDFEGITGEKTFVLETTDSTALLQEFLPFVLSAERFHRYAIANSRGSVNPYLNWGELAAYEFDLPPLDEQERLADLLWAVEHHRRAVAKCMAKAVELRVSFVENLLDSGTEGRARLGDLVQTDVPITYGIVQAGPEVEGGVPYVRVSDMTNGVLTLDGMKRTSPTIAAKFARSRVQTGDLVVALRGRTGLTLRVPDELDGANLTQGTARVAVDADVVDVDYVAAVMNSSWMATEIGRKAKGSTFTELTLSALRDLPVPRMGRDVERAFLRDLIHLTSIQQKIRDEMTRLDVLAAVVREEIFGGD
jgi:type I restriction enzyme, S subunit